MIKKLLAGLAVAVVSFTGYALEVDDLHMPLSRTEADDTLTKDYSFEVLNDGTVRRTWNISKRTVCIDFDPEKDAAICITITYDSPVGRKTADADAEKMAGPGAGKWKKTKPDAVDKVGIAPGAMIKEMGDAGMMFLECNAKGKCTRLSLFAKAPKGNRYELSAVDGDARTALGSTSTHGNIKYLIQDEEARKAKPGKAVASSSSSSDSLNLEPTVSITVNGNDGSGSSAESTTTTTSKPVAVAKPAKASTPRTSEADTVSTVVEERVVEEKGKDYDNLADVVKGEISPLYLGLAGAIVVVLLLLIGGSISRSRAKARQRANFANVLISTPAPAPKGKKKPAPAPKLRVK